MQTKQSNSKRISWLEWAVVLAIISLATYLRYWRIEEVPPGFNSDEAVGAVGALRTLREGLSYSYEGQGGGGVLGFYFAAAFFYLFGPSIATIRGLAAWAAVVSIFAHYWAVRELFLKSLTAYQSPLSCLNRARLIAGLSTLGLSVSVWHLQASRIAFAGIGVPFLMLPSIYFLWRGLNAPALRERNNWAWGRLWPFILSGVFLGGLMYIYLSGIFVPLVYAVFFITHWLLLVVLQRLGQPTQSNGASSKQDGRLHWRLDPSKPYLYTHFWGLFATALTAILLLIPIVFVLLNRPELDPGTTRVNQASFLNPNINQGDPWGLLWRSFVGNFGAFGISFSWFVGQVPRLSVPAPVGLLVLLGFLISAWRGLRGQAAYLFTLIWFGVMLLPSILSPDVIPHTLRAIGATSPTYILAAVFMVWLVETLWFGVPNRIRLPLNLQWLARGAGLVVAAGLLWSLWQASAVGLYQYFYIFPQTNDAKAAYHVYAVEMADEINREPRAEVAFILPRNTAAGDVYQNFTTEFLTELEQPAAAHYWIVDDEDTLAQHLTAAAAKHSILRVVTWKTSKHTGADPKHVIPYYLEKYGRYQQTDTFEYFDIDTYVLETNAPDFQGSESLRPASVDFNGQLQLAGYALGDAGDMRHLTRPQAFSDDLLWLRLSWRKVGEHSENLKVSALIYANNGQLITQVDKLLLSNILQIGSSAWPVGAQEDTYFLIPVPPATPPGDYTLYLAVYEEKSLSRLSSASSGGGTVSLAEFTVQPAQKPVDPATLELARPVDRELLPGLTLVGFETLPGASVRSGDEVWASLLWQAGQSPLNIDLSMLLVVQSTKTDAEWPLSEPVELAGTGYPTSHWQPGEFLRGWLKARIPPTLEPDIYELDLRLVPTNKPQAETLTLRVGEFKIEGWPRRFDPPQPQVEITASFNSQARLVGLDADTTQVAPGDTINTRLYWQAQAEFQQNYTMFVHLIGPDGLLYGQVDHIPGAGAYPTTGWLPGEYIADEYAIPVAQNAPPGDYQLIVGLYDPDTGQRLTIGEERCQGVTCSQGDNAVKLLGLTVK